MRRVLLFAWGLQLACAAVPSPRLAARATRDATALAAAAEDFYRAATVAQLDAALERARAQGADTALFHELAAHRAVLAGRDDQALEHLLGALFDPHNPAAPLHLHLLGRLDWPLAWRPRLLAALEALSTGHPSAEVRALAAWQGSNLAGILGKTAQRDALLARVEGPLAFDVAGTWDNEQGKAFDAELSPEVRPGLEQTYVGRAGRAVAWRRGLPADARGRLDLGSLLYPSTWSVAFAQARFTAPAAGSYALRLTSTDPLKVWVDGRLVFQAVQLEQTSFDQVVVPLQLSPGEHRVVVKSAQRDGTWWLLGRVSREEGPVHGGESAEAVALARAGMLPDGLRQAWALAAWAHLNGGGNLSVQAADAWLRLAPGSLMALARLTDALWFNQERGRTADVLAALDKEVGDSLGWVRLRQVRFHLQQGLRQKARERLVAFLERQPEVLDARELLAEVYRAEDWAEDELSTLTQAAASSLAASGTLLQLANAQARLGRRPQQLATLERLRRLGPGSSEALGRLADFHAAEGRLEQALALVKERLARWPVDAGGLMQQAELERRAGQGAAALRTLSALRALCPEHAPAFSLEGALAWEAGQKDAAVRAWKHALELNPDDEKLANRLEFVSPEKKGPWAADVPDEAGLERVVGLRDKVKRVPGADVAYLLDHEVTQLGGDGSTQNVVTLVMHALTADGRDRMTRQSLAGNGRVRVLQAWAMDEKGRRSEASSERGRQVFFRGLTVGSTTVLQYRLDAPPDGYLSRHLSKSWVFQGTADQRVLSRFVLWLPADTRLHEESVGEVRREEERRGGARRVAWSAGDTLPLTPEPHMPPGVELLANLKLSTVPDWDAWLAWEKALLEGAFRTSPEVDQLARRLGESGEVGEEVRRIHEFVMQDIRYQQDYETFIAGVKPHPAPMVLERRYGDCKDKAVLFITLAQRLGIDAHFALARTRDVGPASPNVPMQQFNHAIVYVPEQPGFPEGRFFDPTADALDLEVLRGDDAGTRALVFDPKQGAHTWREVPYQGPDANFESFSLALTLAKDGSAEGSYALSARGATASALRRVARNTEVLGQGMQRAAAALVTGASTRDTRPDEVRDLRAPARVTAQLTSRTAARLEGQELRVRLPSDWNPRTLFGLAERRFPLVLGTPRTMRGELRLTLPEGFAVSRLPAPLNVELPCLTLARAARLDGEQVVLEQQVRYLCERVSAQDYPRYREAAEAAGRALEEDLVLGPKKAPAGKRR